MGLLDGMETTMLNGEHIAQEIAAKNLLFGYIYCYFPISAMLACACPDGWTKNSCHIELDTQTFDKLVEIGAIKPVDHNIIYEMCHTKTVSQFDPAVYVPIIYCKCSEWILDEYDAWHDGCVARGDSDAIENMKNRLKQHMNDYYNKNRNCYGTT